MRFLKNINYEQVTTFVMITSIITLTLKVIIDKSIKRSSGSKLKLFSLISTATDIGLCVLVLLGIAAISI